MTNVMAIQKYQHFIFRLLLMDFLLVMARLHHLGFLLLVARLLNMDFFTSLARSFHLGFLEKVAR